jgi:gliding motility-associated lipoprotein GldD
MRICLFGFFAFLSVALAGCKTDYQPKPKGYNRLVLPPAEYRVAPDSLPYQFEYSRHARLLKDSSWIAEKHWMQVYYPDLKAALHITYKRLRNQEDLLRELMDDSYRLTSKHQIRASGIDEVLTRTPSGKTAVIAEISGDVPSQFQFTMTDSSLHFIRGAVYFNTEVKNDSLAPAIEFMKKETMHLINTLAWKKK